MLYLSTFGVLVLSTIMNICIFRLLISIFKYFKAQQVRTARDYTNTKKYFVQMKIVLALQQLLQKIVFVHFHALIQKKVLKI